MVRSVALAAALLVALAGCDRGSDRADATPDAADAAAADAQPAVAAAAVAASSPAALPLKKPSATDLPMAGAAATPAATVGMSGFGAVQFGMHRGAVEHAAPGPFEGAASGHGCEQAHRLREPLLVYMFEDDQLQRIDVRTPGVLAEGGGRVGMQDDEIRTLYAGKLSESPAKYVQGGHDLRVGGKSGPGMVFETDAKGVVTAFRAGLSPALDNVEGCS